MKRSLLLLLLTVGCVAEPARPRAQEAPTSLTEVRFGTEGERARHAALREWIVARSAGFHHRPLRTAGNFLGEMWCGPEVPVAACEGGAVVGSVEPGHAWRSLETLFYPDAPRDVFGVCFGAGANPRGPGVAVHVSWDEGGRTVVGDSFALTFVAFAQDGSASTFHLGAEVACDVHQATVSVRPPGGWREEVRRLAASPDAFAATARERHAELRARIEQALSSGEVLGWTEGPYAGGGVPPERTPRPLTDEERTAMRARAMAELDRRVALIDAHGPAFHAALVRDVPVEVLLR